MKIEQITVTGLNMVEVMQDESIYVINKDHFDKKAFRMIPIAKCEIGDLISGKVGVIKITK